MSAPSSAISDWLAEAARQKPTRPLHLPTTETTVVTADTRNKRKQKALDEEEYTTALERIIQRDFFPDLPQLRSQLAYMEAMEQGDFEQMRAIASGASRTGMRGDQTEAARSGNPLHTPALRFPTPLPTSASSADTAQECQDSAMMKNEQQERMDKDVKCLSLDAFQQRYTSEDNQSFMDMIEKQNEAKRRKYNWIYDQKTKQLVLAAPDHDDQKKLLTATEQGHTAGWTYKPKNALMWFPEGSATSQAPDPTTSATSSALVLRGDPKSIQHAATRLDLSRLSDSKTSNHPEPNSMALITPEEALSALQRSQANQQPISTPRVHGYSFVNTPSPMPGREGETPLLTWGSLDGTPLILHDRGDSTPLHPSSMISGNGGFRVPATSQRDELGRRLADQVAAKRARRASPAIFHRPGSSGKDGVVNRRSKVALSPAAQALLQKTQRRGTPVPLASRTDSSPLVRPRSSTPRRM